MAEAASSQNALAHVQRRDKGDIMSKSMLIMALICLIVTAGFTAAASAQCPTCGMEGTWNPDEKLNQIGNPAAQQDSQQPFGPAAARQTNSQFDNGKLQNGTANNSSNTNSAEQMPTPNIDLKNISAMPNPTNPGSPVKITAVLGDVANMTAYAIIKSSFGVQVGNVTLEPSSGGEYVGTWTSSIATGLYNTTIVASASGLSRTFNDALQIDIEELSNATASSNGKPATYTKLG